MDPSFKEILWMQFGAALDMLENALVVLSGGAMEYCKLLGRKCHDLIRGLIDDNSRSDGKRV